jgi:hypothetical protein
VRLKVGEHLKSLERRGLVIPLSLWGYLFWQEWETLIDHDALFKKFNTALCASLAASLQKGKNGQNIYYCVS